MLSRPGGHLSPHGSEVGLRDTGMGMGGRRGPSPGVRNGWYGMALDMLRDIEERGMDQGDAVAAAAARTGRKASTLEHMVQVGRYVRDKGPDAEVRGTLSVFQVLRSLERKAPERVGELFRIALAGDVGRTGMQGLVREAAAGRPVAWPPPPRPARRRAGSPADSPREVVPAATVDAMAAWLAARAGPGLVVGVWDRHSALSLLACARADARLPGLAGRVTALCFGGAGGRGSPAADVAAWARGATPGVAVVESDRDGTRDMPGRWAEVARRRGGLGGALVVGSRTATGLWLGDYDDLARSAALEPLAGLWDTEVDAICDDLGVPDLGDARASPHPARAADRRGLDLALMARAGILARGHVEAALGPEALACVDALSAAAEAWPASDAPASFGSPVTA